MDKVTASDLRSLYDKLLKDGRITNREKFGAGLSPTTVRSIVTPIAEKYKLKAVYVFGSYTRGDAAENSDIDLLVDTTGAALTGFFAMGGLYNDL